jgi:hypothetical protein
MEGIENKSSFSALKIILYIAGSLLILFLIYYLVMSLMSPARKLSEINQEYGYKAPEKSKIDERFFTDSAFIVTNREKSFYQARVNMAESDSISLSIDLPDSTAILEISGVTVHKIKLLGIRVSKVLMNADEYAITSMFSTPLVIDQDISSIRKEPLMIKVAPKDTSEYKPDILPDTARVESVNYIFEMKNGLRLYIYQSTDELDKGGFSVFLFDLNDKLRTVRDNLKSISRFKVPEYHPAIYLRMRRSDARIIYRALPKHGMITIFR